MTAPVEGNELIPEAVLEEIGPRADSVWTPSGESNYRKPSRRKLSGPVGRVAIVDGCRTPFSKAGTDLEEMDVVDLAGGAAAELITRLDLDPREIDQSIFGVVVPALHAPNLGREVAFRASLPAETVGWTVNLACASANRAITSGAQAILSGESEVVLAGGAESISNVPIQVSRAAARNLMALNRAKTVPQRLSIFARFRPKDLVPVAPAIAEYSTDMTMGQACEKMAKENAISRQAQDEIAYLSHHRAATAMAEGRFDRQIITAFPPPRYNRAVSTDNGVRGDTSPEALAKLRPVFDKRYGTLTAGNSSPLTDGGSAVLLMSEKKAKALGYEPLGYIRSWAYHALDPASQLLQGPAWAVPRALAHAGVAFKNLDLIEMHEAFAAQMLSNLKAWSSKKFAQQELGRSTALGKPDMDRINVNGGSIALGHPFGATGGRVTIQLLRELQRRDLELGLISVCAAGGTGLAMVVERS